MTTLPTRRSLRTIWVGRERELAELDAGLDDLGAGRGSLFLITGEPGIGKTRLCDELSRRAAARGVSAHWGRAWEAGGAPSFWPFVQIVRSLCRGLDTEALLAAAGLHGAELAELVPEIRRRVPTLATQPIHAERDRFQRFEAISAFLHAVAVRAPQLLVLDDLHAADPSSLQLLHFVARDVRAAPLMVVGAYRGVEARLASEVDRILAQMARDATVIPLRRLARSEVAELVTQATGKAPSTAWLDALHDRTEGNPLFLRELLQLRESTAAEPSGIREVVRARLSLLPPGMRRVIEAAAVLGREIDLQHLAVVVELPLVDLETRLRPAVDAGIIEALEPPARWRFTHVLLREGLYEGLSPTRRAAIHRAAAAALGRGVSDPPLAEIAHHLFHAIPTVSAGEAVDAALRAADRSMSLLAFEDACAWLARAQEMLEPQPNEERRRFEVLLRLGVARIRAGDVMAGKETCRRAADLARRLGDGERLARAALGAACEFVPGVRDIQLIALLQEALAALPPQDEALRARCMAQLAAERQPEPDTEPPMALARAAVAMARRLGDKETLRFALSNAGLALLAVGDPAERLAIDRECLRLALEAGDKLAALRAHLLLTASCWQQGDLAGAAAHFRAYESLVQLRHQRYRWVPASVRALTALWEGRFDEATRWWREAEGMWREDEGRGVEMAAFPVGLCRAAERYDDLPGIEARLREQFGVVGDDLGSCLCEMLIAQLYARARDRRRTSAQLAALAAQPVYHAIQEASWLALLAEPCHLFGEAALAKRIYPALLPRARQCLWLGPLGGYCEPPYDRQLGLLAQTLGHLDAAVEHLRAAEARTVQIGMRSHLARLQYELAGALLARDGAGDREDAAALLDEARALAEELGQTALMPLVVARATEAAGGADAGAGMGDRRLPPASPAFTLRREGDYWNVAWGARTARLRDTRGLQVLAHLVEHPGQEFHVLQLAAGGGAAGVPDAGDAGAVLDPKAVQSYRARLLVLREELEEAERFADAGRAERAREEMERLTDELGRGVGLGGRARRAGGPAERARTAVQKRLRAAIQRIAQELPNLGRHLDQTIRTGTFCGYLPEGRPPRCRL